MITFGSCNRQNKPQNFWEKIKGMHPNSFVWLGDAVYPKGHSFSGLVTAFQQLVTDSPYKAFTEGLDIDGIWDDHDLGVNDAGGDVDNRKLRQNQFIEFLELSGNKDASKLAAQDGLYHFRDYNLNGVIIRIIFLDTRSFRDRHFIRSLGEFDFPLSAIISATIRGSYSSLGFGRSYDGKILGDNQWKWLESALNNTADMTFLASSIQVLTTNPVVESWGHFPQEKDRLLNLLKKNGKENVAFLSGDVHMAEISKATFVRGNGDVGAWYEFTSSGLTHTCANGKITSILCPLMVKTFYFHRPTVDDVFTGKNFGGIQIGEMQNGSTRTVDVSLYSLESPEPLVVLSHHYLMNDKASSSTPIRSVIADDFPILPKIVQVTVYLALTVCILVLLGVVKSIIRRGKRRTLKSD